MARKSAGESSYGSAFLPSDADGRRGGMAWEGVHPRGDGKCVEVREAIGVVGDGARPVWRSVRSNELQNFVLGRRHTLPRFFVSVDSGGVEIE